MRLDGHLMHAIADGALAGTWPCPDTADRAARMTGARTAATLLLSPTLPAGSIATVAASTPTGGFWSNRQMMKLGPRQAWKLVTAIIEDTCYRILHCEEELAVKPHKDTSPITQLYVRGMKAQAWRRQACPEPHIDSLRSLACAVTVSSEGEGLDEEGR